MKRAEVQALLARRGLQLTVDGAVVPAGRAAEASPTGTRWRYTGPSTAPAPGVPELAPKGGGDNETAACVRILRAQGLRVFDFTMRRRTPLPPGMCDLGGFGPRGWWWFEVKVEGGAVRPDQLVFAEDCRAHGVPHGMGDRRACEDFVTALLDTQTPREA